MASASSAGPAAAEGELAPMSLTWDEFQQLAEDSTVTFTEKNPKREGSAAWSRFERYKNTTTIKHAKELGASGPGA